LLRVINGIHKANDKIDRVVRKEKNYMCECDQKYVFTKLSQVNTINSNFHISITENL